MVTYGDHRWDLGTGDVLTVGRGRSCDIRLPDDDHLSRHAGSLRAVEDYVVIRNDSASKPMVLRPPVGEDRVVEPGAATTSLPYGRFALVFTGRGGVAITVDVDARSMRARPETHGPVTVTGPETVTAPIQLTAAQARVLTALCAPVLTRTGAAAVPATYAQIGARLGLQPRYVRNVLKTVRELLSGYGVPGLTAEDDTGPNDDFRWALARWAIRNRWVGRHDVDQLPAEPESPADGA